MPWHGDGFTPIDGGYGWVVVACFIFINSCLLPLVQCFGIIYENQFLILNIPAPQISFLLHLNNFTMCSLGLISGPLLKKFDYRQVSLFGSALVCLGAFLTTFATSYNALIFTIGILFGAGQGILMPGMYLGVNSYFKKRLTLAVSFQVTGACISQIFMPHVCRYLVEQYGVQGTVLILSGISFNAIPATILLRPVNRTSRKTEEIVCREQQHVSERLLSPIYQETTYPAKNKQSRWNEIIKMLDLELFTDRVYVFIIIGMGISFASELNIILMTPFILAELSEFNKKNIATAMSVQSVGDIVGRLLIPFLAHKGDVAPKVMYMMSLFGASVARTLLAVYYDQPVMVFIVYVIIGLSKGVRAVFQSVIIPKFVTLDKLAAATGLSMLFNGILSLLIGPLIAWTHNINNSYIYTLHTATILSSFCVALWTGEFLFTRKNNNKEKDIWRTNTH